MKKLRQINEFILLFYFIPFITLFAQTPKNIEPNIEWTKKQYMAKGFVNTITHLDTNENSFIFLYTTVAEGSFSRSHSYLVKMDMLTGTPQNFKLELKDGGTKRNWEHIRDLDNGLYIISSFQNKKDKRYYIFLETVNKDKLELNKDARKIGEVSYQDIDGSKLDNFVVTVSPNKERILLSYSIVNKNEITRLGIQVFDKDFKQLWIRESDFPRIEGKDVSVGNYTIDNDGNVYLGQNTYDKKREVWNLHLTCFPMNNGEPRVEEVVFSGDKYARSETIICSPRGEIICAGFYSSPGKMSVSGTFSYLYSTQLGTLLSKNEKEFDEDFITMGMNDKDAEKVMEKKDKDKEFDEGYSYYIDRKYQRKDGGFSLIAEKFKIQVQTVRNGNMVTTYYYYNYNDIIVLTYNVDGSIRWVQKIPKYQRLINSERMFGSYYSSINENDDIDIIYNENMKDKMSDKAQPLMVTIDSEGKLSFKEMFRDDKEVRKTFSPILSYKLMDDKYLLGRVNLSRWGAKGTFIHWGVTELK